MFARPLLYLFGTAALLGALIAGAMPLALNAVDRAGEPIPCGNGFRPAYGIAAQQDLLNLDQHTLAGPGYAKSDYTEQCNTLIAARRTASLSVGGAGAALTLVVFVTPQLARLWSSRRHRQTQDTGAAEPIGNEPVHAGVGAQRFADHVGVGLTQPILEQPVGEQIGRHGDAAWTRGAGIEAAAAALRRDSLGDGGRAGGGVGNLYAIAGNG